MVKGRAEQKSREQLNLTGQKWGHMNLASSFLVAGYPIFATFCHSGVQVTSKKVSAFKNEYVMQQIKVPMIENRGYN